jgi:hypothetical protein
VADDYKPLTYLNRIERRLLGPVVLLLSKTANPRLQRALETNGPSATARMACVNALRLYAVALFALGAVARVAGVAPLAALLFVLAVACMVWSFWCLYTVLGPEREFKRGHSTDARSI